MLLFDLAVVADPGPQGITFVSFDPSVALAHGGRRRARVQHGLLRRLRVRRDLQRGVPRARARPSRGRPTSPWRSWPSMYAISSWLLAVSIGPTAIVDPEALVAGGFATRGRARSDHRPHRRRHRAARRGVGRRRAAALRHEPVRRAHLVPQRRGPLRLQPGARGHPAEGLRERAPAHRRALDRLDLTQSALAIVVLAIFALSDQDPVLTLFTWLTNLGALAVMLLLALASFAVVRLLPAPPGVRGGRLLAEGRAAARRHLPRRPSSSWPCSTSTS